MTPRETAEAYVRTKLPELMELSFGCEVQHKEDPDDHHFIFHCSESHPFLFVAKTDGTSGAYLDFDKREYKIIGHPIQLQHWLRVLPKRGLFLDASANFLYLKYTPGEPHNPRRAGMSFEINLTTGQPATEADYKSFNSIVQV